MANIYHFKKLQDEVLRHLDEDGDTNYTLTSVKNALNKAHLKRLTDRDWSFMLWPTPLTFTTTQGIQTYSLHSEFYKPFYFFNQTTKAYMVEMPSRQVGPSGVRWNTDTDRASKFVRWGHSPVETQPTTSGVLNVVSSSAGDDGSAYTVTITGTDSTGKYKVSETLTLDGTTVVTGSVSFSNPILSVTLSIPLAGSMTLKMGSTTLLVLQAGEIGRSYPLIYLLTNPNVGSDIIEYRFYRQPKVLTYNYDLPDIPPPFQQILVFDALIELASYDGTDGEMQIMAWMKSAAELADAMLLMDEEGGLEAEPRYIRYMGDEPDRPRIYSS